MTVASTDDSHPQVETDESYTLTVPAAGGPATMTAKTVCVALYDSSTSFCVNSTTLMGCADPPLYIQGSAPPHQCSRFGSKPPDLHLPLCADVRFHIPMTHHIPEGTACSVVWKPFRRW